LYEAHYDGEWWYLAEHHFVVGADGTRLAVHAAGPARAPLVLLVHGWAQSARCWHRQLDDPGLTGELRVAAVDLRGHGCSDRPARGYHDPAAWAGDLHAVLTAVTHRPAVLVGWSYGGLVIADYLASHGTGRTAGVLLVGAITGLGRGVAAGRIGPVMRAALPDALSDDPQVAVPALGEFVRSMTAAPVDGAQQQAMLAAALDTPPRVRAALFDRRVDGAHLVGAITRGPRPVLVQHGSADGVVDPSTARHHLATVPGAEADWWAGTGHLPFVEDPPRFGRTLLSFARQCSADRERMTR
jgi:pimeloyl-ACP methyl ester carboxylesterase